MKPRVDVAALRAALAGYEQLAAEQAHLPVDQRLQARDTDGTVLVDVVALSIAQCRALLAEADKCLALLAEADKQDP